MLGIPQKQASQNYRTLAKFVRTTRRGNAFVCTIHYGYWHCWMAACLLILVTLMLGPLTAKASRFGIGLTNEEGRIEHIGLLPLPLTLTSERTSSSMVGTIMALLATLEEAGVLPPEGTPQANQVIHGLIQFQSTLMKSTSSELAAYRIAAEAFWGSQHSERVGADARGKGLTSKVLGAFIDYDQEYPLWDDSKIVLTMQEFNVTRADWVLIVDLFQQAEAIFREQGRSIHSVYKAWRMHMPGRKS